MSGPINVVVFSRDRPMQLSACIRSFLMFFQDLTQFKLTVIYKATTKDYLSGYKKVFSNLPTTKPDWDCFSFVEETDFKRNVLNAVNSEYPLTMFLVDDIIFKDSWSLEDKEVHFVKDNKEIVATSLRLYNSITECYATNSSSKVPQFVKGCVWKWNGCEGDWGYVHSLDGNIFRTGYILPLLKQLQYANPNQLEAQLSSIRQGIPEYMSCYVNGSKLINVPANIVQKEFKNRAGNLMSIEELNKKFLEEDMLIDIKETIKQAENNTSCHIEIPYKWSKF